MLSNKWSWENSYISSITSSWYSLYCLLCLLILPLLGFGLLVFTQPVQHHYLLSPWQQITGVCVSSMPFSLAKASTVYLPVGGTFLLYKNESTAVSPREAFQVLFQIKQSLRLSLCFIILENLLPASYHTKMCLSESISVLHRHTF